MNEIEKAIEFLGYVKGYDIQSAESAISALREQAERSKGCDHCRGWDKRCGANYCPMCGKKLDERLEVEQ